MRHVIPLGVMRLVIERDDNTCRKCGKVGTPVFRFGKPAVVENPENIPITPKVPNNDRRLVKFEFHHKTPVFVGGDNSPDNLELRCRACNRADSWVSYVAQYLPH